MSRLCAVLVLLAAVFTVRSASAQGVQQGPIVHGSFLMTGGQVKVGKKDASFTKLLSVQLAIAPRPDKPVSGRLNLTEGSIEGGTMSQVFLGVHYLSTSPQYKYPIHMEGGFWWDSQKIRNTLTSPYYASQGYAYVYGDQGAYVSGVAVLQDNSQAALMLRIGKLVSLELQASYTTQMEDGTYFRGSFSQTYSAFGDPLRQAAQSSYYGGTQSLAESHVEKYRLMNFDFGGWDEERRMMGSLGLIVERHELHGYRESFLGLGIGGFRFIDAAHHVQCVGRLEFLSGGDVNRDDYGGDATGLRRFTLTASYNW